MVYLFMLFTLPLLSVTNGGRLSPSNGLNQTDRAMTKVSRRETPLLPPPYLHLPVFVESRLPLVDKEHFSPSRGTGLEPLPQTVREILLPVRQKSSPPRTSGISVKTSCEQNKMLVQVERSILGTGEPKSQVKLGTCKPSKATRDSLYFEYDLDMCGTKQTIINNQVAFSNTLRYDPHKLQGPIRRTVSFSILVSCYYNRYQYSYKIGYKPKMRMRKIFKPMKNRVNFILTPRNAKWERIFPSDQYALGKPMYFEAEAPSMSQNQRLYVHLCYATPEKSHNSRPQFQVVKNFGCMAESKDGHSRFIPYKNNAVRFTVDAFLFRGMTGQQLYMHCSMSVGSSIPTSTAKACNYDTKAKRWVELYGPDSVCSCCDSTCSSAAPKVTKIISSKPWTIEPKEKLKTASKRKKVSTTTATKTTTATTTKTTEMTTETTTETTLQPETTREVRQQRATLQPERRTLTTTGKVANTVKELEWPFGGGGVHWVEIDEEEEEEEEKEKEKQVKGSAAVVVLDADEEDEKVVTQPRTIFEEVFDFEK